MRFTSCFVGIPLPEKFQPEFEDALRKLQTFLPSARLVHKETPHITLYYLNAQPQDSISEIIPAIERYKSLVRDSGIVINSLGVFNPEFVRVLFAKVQHDESLELLHKKLCTDLNQFYAEDNNLGFHAHLTLARLTDDLAREQFKNNKAEVEALLNSIYWEFKMKELVLYGVDSTQKIEYQQKLETINV